MYRKNDCIWYLVINGDAYNRNFSSSSGVRLWHWLPCFSLTLRDAEFNIYAYRICVCARACCVGPIGKTRGFLQHVFLGIKISACRQRQLNFPRACCATNFLFFRVPVFFRENLVATRKRNKKFKHAISGRKTGDCRVVAINIGLARFANGILLRRGDREEDPRQRITDMKDIA